MTPSKVPGRGEAAGAVGLALLLDGLTYGLTRDEIRAEGVLGSPDDSDDAFRKQFARARERLGKAGIAIRERACPDGEVRYAVDAGLTYGSVDDIRLSPEEALRLFALVSCCLQGRIPYADDLRSALARIASLTSTHASTPPAAEPAAAGDGDEPLLEAITQAHARRRAARISYEDAKGRRTTRIVRAYGFFQRRGHSYFAAADDASGQVRVFRVGRLRSVSVLDDASFAYRVPSDFDIRDFMRLPFQYGTEHHELVLREDTPLSEQRRQAISESCGTWNGKTWRAEAADAQAAAQWATFAALSENVTPTGDADVMARVRAGLAEVARMHG